MKKIINLLGYFKIIRMPSDINIEQSKFKNNFFVKKGSTFELK